jgi:hypothetical protein
MERKTENRCTCEPLCCREMKRNVEKILMVLKTSSLEESISGFVE